MNRLRRSPIVAFALVLLVGLPACGGENVFPPVPDGSAPVSLDGGAFPTPDQSPAQPPPPAPSCHTFEHPFQGHCYSVVGLGWMDYDAAAKLCANHKAKVASILTAAENDFIYKLLDVTTQAAWIGLRRNLFGKFGWVDGKPFSFNKWAPGEPSSGSERCAVIWGPGLSFADLRGTWNDAQCVKPTRDTVICKR
jgi:Lectin C-type domain